MSSAQSAYKPTVGTVMSPYSLDTATRLGIQLLAVVQGRRFLSASSILLHTAVVILGISMDYLSFPVFYLL